MINAGIIFNRVTLRKLANAIYRDFFFSIVKKKNDIFNIFAQNIDRSYTFEPPRPPRWFKRVPIIYVLG